MAIHYAEYFDSGKKVVNRNVACFSDMMCGRKKTARIIYICKVANIDLFSKEKITLKQVKKYCLFLCGFLDKNIFSYKIIQTLQGLRIVWILNTKDLTRSQALFYLTAFRYPYEYSSYVLAIGNSKLDSLEKEFLFFQQCHLDSFNGSNKKYHLADGGHSLISMYALNASERVTPLSLKDFKINFSNKEINLVNNFWKKSLVKA